MNKTQKELLIINNLHHEMKVLDAIVILALKEGCRVNKEFMKAIKNKDYTAAGAFDYFLTMAKRDSVLDSLENHTEDLLKTSLVKKSNFDNYFNNSIKNPGYSITPNDKINSYFPPNTFGGQIDTPGI